MGRAGGLILHNWQVAEVSQALQDYDDIAMGQDFGFNHANAILLLGWKDGDVYVLRELYVYEKDTSEIIPLAASFPRRKKMWCDSAEPDRIKMWRSSSFLASAVSKERGSVQAQIDWLKQRRVYVHPSCVNTIAELQQWKWKKDEKTGLYLDEPVPFQDDAMAALRYGVEGWRKPKLWLY
ncbi:MAG: terminase large subunit [Clostridiales bacterium]|nr:terminase large subunit [Clostridiales bacterium]